MSKKKRKEPSAKTGVGGYHFPKNALSRINLGQAFAEYDLVNSHAYLFVRTPAFLSALEPDRAKSFYVGRRGTGKTAITIAIANASGGHSRVYPELFSPLTDILGELDFSDTHKQPFRSLIAAFRRALQAELIRLLVKQHPAIEVQLSRGLRSEVDVARKLDFDLAVMDYIEPLLAALRRREDRIWLQEIGKAKASAKEMDALTSVSGIYTIVIDRVDEAWDGSDNSVIFLIALMHACLEVSTQIHWARVLEPIRITLHNEM